jgi:diphosphomevalonate decarboxylase
VSVTVQAHPSLALAKYWGKQLTTGEGSTRELNVPATPSIAVTLDGLVTRTTAQIAGSDSVVVNGQEQPLKRYTPVLDALRIATCQNISFRIDSTNSFPTAAGLASSAAGFAALVSAALHEVTGEAPEELVSRIARIGSGSACRSAFGGFTRWDTGALEAQQIAPVSWWQEFCVVVLPVAGGPKEISSRDGMNRTRDTSPFYQPWIEDAPPLADEVESAVLSRDIERLGNAARRSYMRMFATMLGANPPILYWLPESVRIIRELENLRRKGVPVWETMDAGPQVKVITLRDHADAIADQFRAITAASPVVCTVGPPPTVVTGHHD